MACPDQSGVQSIQLIENINFSATYTEGAIASTNTSGETIGLTSCYRPDYSDNENIGANFKLMHNHNIKFYVFEYEEGVEKQEQINNVFGWYALITFNSGYKYLVNSPIFYQESPAFDSANTHTWEINLQSEVDTYDGLLLCEN